MGRNRMKVLNCYSGIGGNRKLWTDCEVTAVEYNEEIASVYKDLFPKDNIIVGDAHQYLLDHYDEYDFIWSSPPCPTHSRMMKATRHDVRKYPDMNLYQEIIFLDHFFNGKWIVENVVSYYEPLIPCKKISRHFIWSNFKVSNIDIPKPEGFIQNDNPEYFKNWLGLNFEGNIYVNGNHSPSQVLRNCVHPKLGLHVFNAARGIIEAPDTKQANLF